MNGALRTSFPCKSHKQLLHIQLLELEPNFTESEKVAKNTKVFTLSQFFSIFCFSTSFPTKWRAKLVFSLWFFYDNAFYQLFTICYAIFIKHLKDLLLNLYITINMWRNKLKCDKKYFTKMQKKFVCQNHKRNLSTANGDLSLQIRRKPSRVFKCEGILIWSGECVISPICQIHPHNNS